MAALNFKHLRYFWVVAKSGAIARAAEQLHLTPQSISGQLRELEESLGVELFRRAGRGLELTEAGRRILRYAEEIFTLGDELLDVVRDQSRLIHLPFRVGIADSVLKSVAQRVVAPALHLAELAVHRLDMVIADRSMPANLNVRGYSHLLGESDLTVFGAPAPTAIADDVCAQYGVVPLGCIAALREQLYAITTERRLTHPAIIAIRDVARYEVFGGQTGKLTKKPTKKPTKKRSG